MKAVEDISAPGREQTAAAPEGRQRLIRVLTVAFAAGALYATVLAFLWFAADFIAASIYSPNLDQAQQVSDFNDFAHISDMLARYRFLPGVLALVMSVALMVLAVVINDPRERARPVFLAGGIALLCLALLLARDFSWLFALLFAATAVALLLATEWPSQAEMVPLAEAAEDKDGGDSENVTPATVAPEHDATAPEPVFPSRIDADNNDVDVVAPTAEMAATETREENIAPQVADESRINTRDEVDKQAVESFGLELESDINLDLEPDYELASDPETESDPLLLLSQEDLGINEDDALSVDDTIETAAAIEAEIEAEISLEQADTAQIKAMIDSAGDHGKAIASPDDGNENMLEPEPREPAPAPQAIDFNPQELARQESLLPPPRACVWNLLDWIILMVIVFSIIVLLIINL